MKQFARSKKRQREVSDYFSFRSALLAEAPSMDDARLREGVESILSGSEDERRVWAQVFEKVGSRGVRFLLDATRDPRCDALVPYLGEECGHAFATVTRTLAYSGDLSIIRLLSHWASSDERKLRDHALICIGHAGLAESVPFLRRAIRSDSDDDLAYALIGIDWGARTAHASPFFRTELTKELLPLCLPGCKRSTLRTYMVPEVLTKLAPVDAVRLLSGPEYLCAENPLLSDILRAINKTSARLDQHAVQSLLTVSRSKPPSEGRWNNVRIECLKALALIDPADACREIDVELVSAETDVREGAVDALRMALALPDWYSLWGPDEAFESLPEVVQNIVGAVEFEDQVNYGGISQYLFNSSGDRIGIALRAFRAIGATECERVLTEAISFVGSDGSSSDRSTRIDTYAKLSDESESTLDELSTQFYRRRDKLHLSLVRYMEANRSIVEQRAMHVATKKAE